jgi:hypothetical protein
MKTKTLTTSALELLGLTMIGEGIVGLLFPRRYVRFWKVGPQWLRAARDSLADHPNATSMLCACEIAAGFWLAVHQLDQR